MINPFEMNICIHMIEHAIGLSSSTTSFSSTIPNTLECVAFHSLMNTAFATLPSPSARISCLTLLITHSFTSSLVTSFGFFPIANTLLNAPTPSFFFPSFTPSSPPSLAASLAASLCTFHTLSHSSTASLLSRVTPFLCRCE